MNADGSGKIQLTFANTDEMSPCFSPDGSKIVFASNYSGDFDVWIMDADGENPVQLTQGYEDECDPGFSPDGEKIVYAKGKGGEYNLWIMDADGKNAYQVTHARGNNSFPCWSPDGSMIAFSTNRGGDFDIWVLTLEGSAMVSPAGGGLCAMRGEKLKLAIMPFSGKGDISGEEIQDFVISSLAETKRFSLIERAQIAKVFEEQKMGLLGVVDSDNAAQVGKLLGADAVGIGSISTPEGGMILSLRIVDTETGEVLASATGVVGGKGISAIKSAVEKMTRKILNSLPKVETEVLKVKSDKVWIKAGANKGIVKGTRCVFYKVEDEGIIEPVAEGVIVVVDVKTAGVKIIKMDGVIEKGMLVITK